MDLKEIRKKLNKQRPAGYTISKIIPFDYPFRKVKIKATVCKHPERSIQQIYTVLLKTIDEIGYDTKEQIASFLGLHKEDFILRELSVLIEKGFLDWVSGVYLVTEEGKNYIKNNKILKILEEEKFAFLIDAVTEKVVPLKKDEFIKEKNKENEIQKVSPEINYPLKNPDLLKGKDDCIKDIYKKEKKGQELVDFEKSNILDDTTGFCRFYFIRYEPRAKQSDLEPIEEIRNKFLKKNKTIDKKISDDFQ